MTRLVSWNLHGANVPGRASVEQQTRAWDYARALGADLILAQEVRASAIPAWVGWTFLAGELGRFRKTWDWGSVIAARDEFVLTQHEESLNDPWLGQLYDLVLVGRIDLGGSVLAVVSVHTAAVSVRDWLREYATPLHLSAHEMSALRRPGCKEPPFLNDLAFEALTRTIGEDQFIAAGDWNTCRRYAGGPEFFSRTQSRGGVEWHRLPEEQSYFSKRCGAYQLDHAFTDTHTAESGTTCLVHAPDEVRALSDHAPLILDIGTTRV